MLSVRLRTVFLLTVAASGVAAAVVACSEEPNENPASTASQVRNDGKEPTGTNPGKLSCADHGFLGADTKVDLGGVNRTLDLGGGQSCTVSGVKKGPEWVFDFTCTVDISTVLMRSGNLDSFALIDPAKKSGRVTRSDAQDSQVVNGGTKPGLNRIAFCFVPPVVPDASVDAPPTPPDAAPDAPTPPPDAGDGGKPAW